MFNLRYLSSIFLLLIISGCGGKSIDTGANSESSLNQSTSDNSSTKDSQAVTYSTDNILCDLNELTYNNDESINANSSYGWTCNTQDRILTGNGIPNHEVGTFPNSNNPNTISVQLINKTFTNNPNISNENGIAVGGPEGVIAYALNSVKFDPGTAGKCDNSGNCSLAGGSGSWNIEALGHDTFDFGDDMNHAHVQPGGAYHYHGMPELYLEKLGKGRAMSLIGWAADGFPVYARYGYTDINNLNSSIKIMKPSWQLKTTTGSNRPNINLRTGDAIVMSAFTQDFEYIANSGDLDQCNGRFSVTPEFPEGIYHYMVTDDFPFFSRCLKGSI